MSSAFCPECGEETDPDELLCDACYADSVDPVEAPENLELRVCSVCGSYVDDGDWTSEEDDVSEEHELAVERLQDSLRAHVEAESPRVDLRAERVDPDVYHIYVSFTADVRGYPVHDDFKTTVNVSRETCPTCARISGGYYESIVQIRGENRLPTDDELHTAKEIAYGIAGDDLDDRDTFVTDVKDVDDGIDIYLSTNKAGLQTARRVIEEFGGTYSDSATLVGEKDGDELYRVTYSVRLPEFREGDLLLFSESGEDRDRPVLVTHNSTGKGDVEKAVDLVTGDEIRTSSFGDAEKIGDTDDSSETVVVDDSDDEIQILDPETYETVTLRKPDFMRDPGDEVEAVTTEEGVFLLP
ncbi:60S ribosomal export protein NMD3 [Halorutilales archaeon Cl-col2-1]